MTRILTFTHWLKVNKEMDQPPASDWNTISFVMSCYVFETSLIDWDTTFRTLSLLSFSCLPSWSSDNNFTGWLDRHRGFTSASKYPSHTTDYRYRPVPDIMNLAVDSADKLTELLWQDALRHLGSTNNEVLLPVNVTEMIGNDNVNKIKTRLR